MLKSNRMFSFMKDLAIWHLNCKALLMTKTYKKNTSNIAQ